MSSQTVEHLTNTEIEQVNDAVAGEQVHRWLNSEMGMRFLARTNKDIEEAQLLLEKVSPHDIAEIERLQRKAAVARTCIEYMKDIIKQGEIAALMFTENRNEGDIE